MFRDISFYFLLHRTELLYVKKKVFLHNQRSCRSHLTLRRHKHLKQLGVPLLTWGPLPRLLHKANDPNLFR
jgi:hypothetical protein